jgi:uncharacterized protein YbjT (DUF2867 family)
VARSADRLKVMVRRKVEAYAGDIMNTEFLVKALTGSDAVFTLIPPNSKAEAFTTYADAIGESIAHALELAKIKHVVNLSSVGAELPSGTGPIAALHNQEDRLNRIKGLNVLHLRAAYFMENLLANMDMIGSKGINGSPIRGEIKFAMIATRDIAVYAAERLAGKDFSGSSFVYLLGPRDISMIEATITIGMKVGMPDLPYMTFPYDQAEKAMTESGLSPDMSRTYVEMARAFNEGRIKTTRTPESTTMTTFDQFCQEVLVPAFHEKKKAA